MKRKIVVSLMILMFPMLVGCQKESMILKAESVTIEFGKNISLKAEDYLKNEKDFLDKVVVTTNAINQERRDYPAVGEYEVTLKYENKNSKSVKVYVKDTEPPEFLVIENSYEVKLNTKFDKELIRCGDLSSSSIEVNDSKVNYKKAGTYKATVIAKDESNNETKKEIEIVVREEKKKEQATTEKNNNSTNPQKSNKKPNSSNTSKPSSGGNTPTNTTQLSAKSSRGAFDLINKEREKVGVSILVWDNELAEIAMQRAKELSSDFSHKKTYRSDGRLVNAENAAKDYTSVDSVVTGWYNSSSHKKAMLRDTYTKCAVARYGNYWVALFTK